MTPKHQLYLSLCRLLSSRWGQDAEMFASDPDTWLQARAIDDWLVHYGGWTILLEEEPYNVLYQDHGRVSVEQYRRVCDRLAALYVGFSSYAVAKGEV